MTYEYECTSPLCKHTWEEDQKITAQSIGVCPKCQQQTAKRLISKSSFILKGDGWFNKGGY
jgi:putative FmdB family regulatory protein